MWMLHKIQFLYCIAKASLIYNGSQWFNGLSFRRLSVPLSSFTSRVEILKRYSSSGLYRITQWRLEQCTHQKCQSSMWWASKTTTIPSRDICCLMGSAPMDESSTRGLTQITTSLVVPVWKEVFASTSMPRGVNNPTVVKHHWCPSLTIVDPYEPLVNMGDHQSSLVIHHHSASLIPNHHD